MDVFKYRAFLKKDVFTYVKDGNEDKFMNGYVYRAIDSTRERYFQYYNYDKRRSHLSSESLDNLIEENGDSYLVDNKENKFIKIDKIIKSYVDNNDIYEALVLYAVIYGDSFSNFYEEGVKKTKYSPKKLAHIIKDLSQQEIDEFTEKYADNKDISFELEKYRYCSNAWNSLLYSIALDKLKENEELKNLCF